MTDAIDSEFSPVLAHLHERGAEALENFRRGTHSAVAPEVVSHMKALLQESRKYADRLVANKRDLDASEKRIVTELNEQRQIILSEMEREVSEGRAKMRALKEQQDRSDGGAGGGGGGGSSPTSSSPPGGASFAGGSGSGSGSGTRKPSSSFITQLLKDASSNSSTSAGSAMPGDVDYWRAQAHDLALVVEGRREALKSVQARMRSISHLDEHQARARGIIGLLRQAEAAERQKAAEYLRQAHAIREKAGLSAPGGSPANTDGADAKDRSGASTNNNDSGSGDGPDGSAIAVMAEAEAQGLESILNAIEPRVEVSKEAVRLYTDRHEVLQARLAQVGRRRKQLSSIGSSGSATLPAVLKYVSDIKAECQDEMNKVAAPNLAILNILKKQHGEALQRIGRKADDLISHRLEIADLESQLRESRVRAIRSMHGTGKGTDERLAQLRAWKGAEVVQNQIMGIEQECGTLRHAVALKDTVAAAAGAGAGAGAAVSRSESGATTSTGVGGAAPHYSHAHAHAHSHSHPHVSNQSMSRK